MLDFEAGVKDGLAACGVDLPPGNSARAIGVAVSGGADSVAMLAALCAICKDKIPLRVITVNHNIRAEEVSRGDADFVGELCARFAEMGTDVDCTTKEIPRGKVWETERLRNGGTEEAARFLRYEIFEEFAAQKNVGCVCTAHTKDDNIETVLMRFLQGGSPLGIRRRRGIFARPLLDVSRRDVEDYLKRRGIGWREDSTNGDTSYLRNRIRHELVPRFDGLNFEWRNSVLAGAERARDSEEAVAFLAEKIGRREEAGSVCFELEPFLRAPKAARVYALYKAVGFVGVAGRVPYSFVARVADCALNGCNVSKYGVAAEIRGDKLFIKKAEKRATDKGFFIIIQNEGEYVLPFGTLRVFAGDDLRLEFDARHGAAAGGRKNIAVENLRFPFCVRSRMPGDEVAGADGTLRSVSDIFSAWKIPADLRDAIPVVQDLRGGGQRIAALCGGVFGYGDWIVRGRTGVENQRLCESADGAVQEVI